MSLGSRLLAELYQLPRRTCRAVRLPVVMVEMSDGVKLETLRYSPAIAGKHPTLLMRLPYGLRGFATVAECYAERRSEEHTSELQSRENLVCRLLLEKKKNRQYT